MYMETADNTTWHEVLLELDQQNLQASTEVKKINS